MKIGTFLGKGEIGEISRGVRKVFRE